MTPMSSTNRSNNTAKVMLIPNRNRDITVNYEEIKKKEQINKTKNEIFDILKKTEIELSFSSSILKLGNLGNSLSEKVYV